MERQISTIQYC